jgi:hypothetical protein
MGICIRASNAIFSGCFKLLFKSFRIFVVGWKESFGEFLLRNFCKEVDLVEQWLRYRKLSMKYLRLISALGLGKEIIADKKPRRAFFED